MDLKQIKELMTAMERAGIKKMTLKQKSGEEIHLEREGDAAAHVSAAPAFHPALYSHGWNREVEVPARAVPPPALDKKGDEGAASEGTFITAPLVGTFYSAPSPDDPLFVKIGDRVSEGSVVCIIEAMKVMNEVKAGKSGTIAEVLVDNTHPVEFGTRLFRIV